MNWTQLSGVGIRWVWVLVLGLGSPDAWAAGESCDQWLLDQGKGTSEEAKEIEQWQATSLRFSALVESGLLDSQCAETPYAFLECIKMIDALARSSSTPYALIPEKLLPAYAGVVDRIESRFGFLTWVRLNPDREWAQGETPKETAHKAQELIGLYDMEVLGNHRPSFNFPRLLKSVVPQVLNSEREGFQVAQALNALLQMGDSHAYLKMEIERLESLRSGGDVRLVGIGITIENTGGQLKIRQVLPGGPAAQAGLRANDVISAVEKKDVIGAGADRLAEMIRGSVGTWVNLTVLRGSEKMTLRVKRAPIKYNNVKSQLLPGPGGVRIGHILLRSFENLSGCGQIETAIKRFEKAGATGLILDLRGNGGGLLDQGRCIAGLFLGRKRVAYLHDVDSKEVSDIRAGHAKVTDLPMVVLLDSQSASASELVAGALRDHHRAWILGERSFGKGTTQGPSAVAYGDKLQTDMVVMNTIARFHQPGGTSNQLRGIPPNFEVGEAPDQPVNDGMAIREEDLSPNTLPRSRRAWREDRGDEVKRLTQCMDEGGWAEKTFSRRKNQGKNIDYKLFRAQALLGCLSDGEV